MDRTSTLMEGTCGATATLDLIACMALVLGLALRWGNHQRPSRSAHRDTVRPCCKGVCARHFLRGVDAAKAGEGTLASTILIYGTKAGAQVRGGGV